LDNLALYIESLVFATDQPIDRNEVRVALENCFDATIPPEEIDAAVDELKEKYTSDSFAIEVVEIAGGLQFLTKPAFHHVVGSHLKLLSKKRLSKVALETLAIVAYKQPVAKSEIEQIRGVNCDYALQKLLDKELVVIDGRSDGPGRPLLYSTSPKFMDYLGLRDLNDLPKLKDIEMPENSIGESDSLEEDIELRAEHYVESEEDEQIDFSDEVSEDDEYIGDETDEYTENDESDEEPDLPSDDETEEEFEEDEEDEIVNTDMTVMEEESEKDSIQDTETVEETLVAENDEDGTTS